MILLKLSKFFIDYTNNYSLYFNGILCRLIKLEKLIKEGTNLSILKLGQVSGSNASSVLQTSLRKC